MVATLVDIAIQAIFCCKWSKTEVFSNINCFIILDEERVDFQSLLNTVQGGSQYPSRTDQDSLSIVEIDSLVSKSPYINMSMQYKFRNFCVTSFRKLSIAKFNY